MHLFRILLQLSQPFPNLAQNFLNFFSNFVVKFGNLVIFNCSTTFLQLFFSPSFFLNSFNLSHFRVPEHDQDVWQKWFFYCFDLNIFTMLCFRVFQNYQDNCWRYVQWRPLHNLYAAKFWEGCFELLWKSWLFVKISKDIFVCWLYMMRCTCQCV